MEVKRDQGQRTWSLLKGMSTWTSNLFVMTNGELRRPKLLVGRSCLEAAFLVKTHTLAARMLGYTKGLPRQRSAYGIAREDEEFAITEVC